MESVWFVLVGFMLTMYVVLDGFDIGVGIVHWWVGRDERERGLNIRSIGPVWDGNEVWLISAGGTLYFAFPLLYASSFSGFYLPLMMVLWLLMLRGISVEFRHHLEDPVWRSFLDFGFSVASALLAIFLGAALGNVIRGVPLQPDGYFFAPLWTNFHASGHAGILDWYTILAGVLALSALALHGANYLVLKLATGSPQYLRARELSSVLVYVVALLTLVGLAGTALVRPQVLDNFHTHPAGVIFPAIVVGALSGIEWFHRKGNDTVAFVASCFYLAGMLGGAAFGLFPHVLPSSLNDAQSLTVYNTAAAQYGLKIGIIWWTLGLCLAIFYFFHLYRMFSGKVEDQQGSYGD